jgi:hypothetical protein
MAESNDLDRPLHLLVFGRSGSGKSALLTALAQAARDGRVALEGEQTAGPSDLDQLGRQRPAPGATVPAVSYHVRYAPAEQNETFDAVLMDSEGLAASELLTQAGVLEEENPDVPLARDVVGADALVLTIDSAQGAEELDTDFAAFKKLLRIVRQRRGESVDVGGVPVFLVLTHADLLAKPTDSMVDWIERLEERKREVDRQFRSVLDEEDAQEPSGSDEEGEPRAVEVPEPEFGWIDLHVWATAIERPQLRGDTATGAYGVAELFRQCLEEAADYRRDWRKSEHRLRGMVLSVLLLGLLLLGLSATRLATEVDGRTALLASRVEDLRSSFGTTPTEYLHGSVEQLRDQEVRFREVRTDPRFDSLPAEQRSFVNDRLDELSAYIGYSERITAAATPFDLWTAEALERLLRRLKQSDLSLPRESWSETPSGLLYRERLQTTDALVAGVRQLQRWYAESSAEADRLWTFANHPPTGGGIPAGWVRDVADALSSVKRFPPWPTSAPLPGSPAGLLTYADAMRFYEIKDARVGWEVDRDRLSGLFDLLACLELVKEVPERPPLLVFTATEFRWTDTGWQGVGSFGLKSVPGRLSRLKSDYPNHARDFAAILPDRIAELVRQKTRENYTALLAPARAEIERQLRKTGGGTKDPATWSEVARWLGTSRELSAWNELALILLRVIHEQPEAPVPALERFLAVKEVTLELRTVVVEIQRFSALEPGDEPLKIVWRGEQNKELSFNRRGRGKLVGSVTQYTFTLPEKATLVYHPGQEFYAELPLSSMEGMKRRLVWADSRSSLYQFEALRRRPRLQEWREGAPPALSEGRPQSDVRLRLDPDSGVPRVPDLMPDVAAR